MYIRKMMDITELDNQVLKSQLSKKFANKVKIGFGLDVGKIKGVSNFPVYDVTDGFTSNAKKNVDSYMFHSTNKYDVKKGSHTEVGSMNPYLYDDVNLPTPKQSGFRMKSGTMNSLYGLPQDRTIILENPTAQAINMMGGQMTEEKMRDHIWRKEASELDPRIQSIIDGGEGQGSASATTPSPTDNFPTKEDTKVPPPARKIPSPRPKTVIKPIVSQAFPTSGEESKTETTVEETKEESTEEPSSGKVDKQAMTEELYNILKDTDLSKPINDADREKLDKMLKINGFNPVSKRVKVAKSYINIFNNIINGTSPVKNRKRSLSENMNDSTEESTLKKTSQITKKKNRKRLLTEVMIDLPIEVSTPKKSSKSEMKPSK